ncbi:DUF6247 family protein [Mycobacterium sp.]|uniref:DUF6247 family protein n=1 Tax=Mycobacterium sp. TaxID=1785 RepID=UPI00262A0893|nr:DUF6247 family protein [Mycobacterium sp.]
MTAAAHLPEPHGCSAADSDVDGLEPSPEWAGHVIAATKFGSPEAIRAALITEQVAEFDAAFDAALIAARQTLHLDQLRHVLRMWRRQALMTERDPEGHRQMLATIAEVQRTGRPRPAACRGASSRPNSVSDRRRLEVRTASHGVHARHRPAGHVACSPRPDMRSRSDA